MRIAVTVIIELDAADWTLNCGIEGDKAIRADIKESVGSLVGEELRNRLSTCTVSAYAKGI